MLFRILTIAASLVIPSVALAQSRSSVQGVWRVQEIVVTGANASTINNAQPGFWIFTPGHYSIVMITSGNTRPKFEGPGEPANPTPAEKAARYDQWSLLTAQAGTYQIQGATITMRPVVAKNESVMAGPARTIDFNIEGNNLWLTQRSLAGQPVSETRTKLIRVE